MRVFGDACVDPRAAQVVAGHEVQTAFDLGWQNLRDHVLLPMVAADFDVFVTADKGFEYEHNLRNLPMGIVIVHVPKNKLEFYRLVAPQLLAAISSVRPGQVLHVDSAK
jgi:hypothetical protein